MIQESTNSVSRLAGKLNSSFGEGGLVIPSLLAGSAHAIGSAENGMLTYAAWIDERLGIYHAKVDGAPGWLLDVTRQFNGYIVIAGDGDRCAGHRLSVLYGLQS